MFEQNIVFHFIQFEISKLTIYWNSVISPQLVNYLTDYISPYLPYLIITLGVLVAASLVFHLLRLWLVWKEAKRPYVLLEVSPLTTTEQSSFTTTQLFLSVHGLLKQRSWLMRILDIYKSYSFEIVSSKDKGIRYLLRVCDEDASIVKKNLISYLPGIVVKESEDYVDSINSKPHLLELNLSHHFAFPLRKQDNLKEYDPIAYITGTMTKLNERELVGLQVILSPVNKDKSLQIHRLRSLFLGKKDLLTTLNNNRSHGLITSIVYFALKLLLLPVGFMVWIATGGREGPIIPIDQGQNKLPESNYRENVEAQIKQKVDQQLFSASIRLLTSTGTSGNRLRIEKCFVAALSPFTNGGFQSIKPKRLLRINFIQSILFFGYKHRLISLFNNVVLSSSELSDLYHFPYTSTTKTENLSKLYSRELPAPLSLKQAHELDQVFAKNTYGGSETNIGLSIEERRRHVYILGATGTGKSTMLLSMIKQDIKHGKGLCVIDPHGDLAEQILSIIPEERIPEVVYFNPDDISYPMGINLLELTPNLEPEDALREREFIAESIISVFHKIYTDKYSGPRMEYILRNTIHTAFTVPDATLFTIYKLLINTQYRKSVVKGLNDDNLKDFWKYEFAKAGDYQKVKMISPITNKIGRFLFSPTAKRILEQGKSTISFDTIMNEGKILICNLSKGKIGEDNSGVFGVLLMAKLQLAALKRARIKQSDRRDFYLYVDEFQNFATPAFAQILSEARKYRLNAILAHQTTSQLEDNSLVNVTLANTGTVVCFRTANPEDEKAILPQFRPYIEPGEIASLPSYHFYMRLGAMNPEEPFSGVTVPVKIEFNQGRLDEIIESSRRLYASKWSERISMITKSKSISENRIQNNVLP